MSEATTAGDRGKSRGRVPRRQLVPIDRAGVARSLFAWAAGLFSFGLLLGLAARWLDPRVGAGVLDLALADYRTLLSALISGLVTAAVFAIWMRTVVTGLMSAQVSVRVLTSYLDDGFQQRILGLMLGGVGTAISVLLTLPGSGPVPATFSLPLVLVTVVASFAMVLLALNRGVRDLSAQDIMYKLTNRGLELVRDHQAQRPAPGREPPLDEAAALERDVVRSERLGWVVQIDLASIAGRLPTGSWSRLQARRGQLLMPGEPLLTTSADLSDDDHRQVRRAFVLARRRWLTDDLSYLVRQMVDMACGALAASSNDTATADENMKGLGLVLAELTRLGDPQRLQDVDGRWILDEASPGARDITKDAVDRLRVAAAETPSAARQLVDMFGFLARAAREADRDDILEDLQEQVERLLDRVARTELADSDVEDLRGRAVRAGLIADARTDPSAPAPATEPEQGRHVMRSDA